MPSSLTPKPKALLTLGRTVHLIDIENLCGTGNLTAAAVELVRKMYFAVVGVAPRDHVIVGCAHHNALAVNRGWPQARYRWRSGPDGADLVLQEVMGTEALEDRYIRVMLATGDNGFDVYAAQLAAAGCSVTVVAPIGSLGRRLRLAASDTIDLDFRYPTRDAA